MKKSCILFFSVLGIIVSAQSIEGKVSDTRSKPVPFAEVIITRDKKKNAAITDETGFYKIKLPENGDYVLEIFKDNSNIFRETVSINGEIKRNFSVYEKETQVEGITISGRKKLVERKIDRLVFNVENSVASQGSDAIEALGKTPMIRVSDDALSIAGKSSVAVMIDDRLLNLSGQELIDYLKAIRSDDIAKIEVITTPPSKYTAEGRSGLINIILKRNTSLGWNTSFQTSGTYSKNISLRNGIIFNYQDNKLSLTANGSLSKNIWEQRSYTQNKIADGNFWNTDNHSFHTNYYKPYSIKAEYRVNNKNLIGINYNGTFSNGAMNWINKSDIKNNQGMEGFISESGFNYQIKTHTATFFYDVKLDTLNSKVSISANFMSNISYNNNHLLTTSSTTSISALNTPVSQYKIYSGQADLEKNFKKIKTEAGIKFTNINNDASMKYYDVINEENIFNTAKSNDFFYEERNYAAYISTDFKISKNEKWKAKLGLRYEYTTVQGTSPNENLVTKSEYGKVFPTAYVAFKVSDDHTLSLNYSKRISRPYFANLNPFRIYISAYEYSSGNPYLKPSFAHNLELSYVMKNNFTTTLYYNRNIDSWDRIQKIEGNLKYNTVTNFYNEDQAGISINYNFNKFKWLESNLFAAGFYSKSSTYLEDAVTVPAGYGANFNVDNSFFINKDKSVILLAGIRGDLPNKRGNNYSYTSSAAYAGMKLSLMNKNLLISLYFNDIFNTNRSKGVNYYQDYQSDYNSKWVTRSAYLTLNYKFGNSNVKGAVKQTKFEEQNRAGS
ncbi:TonB-dependent receptor domain-containing protein [Chryseobacterium sp. MIQD13]|uniref:TonB-dependent receptor domain-containing protein n=1 Tax=Chryseobacterium sp. MIQD13 TaxID=3422310 RepID=UPI003D29DD34